MAWVASRREGRDLKLKGGQGPDEAGTVPTLSTRKVLVPGLLAPVPAWTRAPWAQGSFGSSSSGCSGLAVGINSSTFTLRSREVNSFSAGAGRPVGGWPQGAEGRRRLRSACAKAWPGPLVPAAGPSDVTSCL